MVNENGLDKVQARELIKKCFSDLAADVDHGFVAKTDDPDAEFEFQTQHWDEMKLDVERQISASNYGNPVTDMARQLSLKHGVNLQALSPGQQQDIYNGIARALLEQRRLFYFRLDDPFGFYTPEDDLFYTKETHIELPQQSYVKSQNIEIDNAQNEHFGPTVSDVVKRYLDDRVSHWTQKTHKANKVRLQYLVDYLGTNKRLNAVTSHDLRDFSDRICRLRNRVSRNVGDSFLEKLTDNTTHQIARKTACLIFEPTKTFFKWARDKRGFIEKNPAENISIEIPKAAKKTGKTRRPFTAVKLVSLFQSPTYTGSKSIARRYTPGEKIIWDGVYWIPLLGYFTGARLGEIVQLHLKDVHLEGDIPYIDITDDNSGQFGEDNFKSVKSIAGIRSVPLHPDIMAIGFEDFVKQRRKLKKIDSDRLFHTIAFGQDGQASTVFSKKFHSMKKSAGLIDPMIVFHSFRHNAEDAFRNAMIPQQITNSIIGHSDGATSAGYGDGPSLEVKYEAVNKMKLVLDIKPLFQGPDTK